MDGLKLNSGLIRLEVDRDGEKGEISFNPSDVRFVDNFYQARQTFLEKEEACKKEIAVLEADTRTDAYGMPINAGKQIEVIKAFAESINAISMMCLVQAPARCFLGKALCWICIPSSLKVSRPIFRGQEPIRWKNIVVPTERT